MPAYSPMLFAEFNNGVRRARTAYDLQQSMLEELGLSLERQAVARRSRIAARKRNQRLAGAVVPVRRIQSSAPQPCGTNAAYVRHLRAKESPCDQCSAAHSVYNIQSRDRNKAPGLPVAI